ncbi:type IV pilus modification PilV family protein [Vibrio mangrovi]|uniref:Prepilin-type N-terminal cleavage/methylation domain-containing protein n=1 Tax=Vibrio mangrovi TaxID=474394 RepID=A0A1Y6IQF9_9VIBR|nr:prepilin-type N-terminal cleavage/methylation domain-containing protein [Vibrio mangrovi]MDW6003331.1 prepilin-type N-terminal cleavage/methylation domain-containing protein [Vibrio mangrovi]SMR99879.1 hypothetical protein VIM7927_01114 [Vibrio mangrovi]
MNRNHYDEHRCMGNTLLEVMVSLVILSVGVLGVCQVQRLTMLQMNEILQRTRALDLAASKLEFFRTHNSQTTGAGEKGIDSEPVRFEQIKTSRDCNSQAPFCIAVLVSEPLFQGDLKVIQVEVSWLGQQRKTHKVALSSMISRFNEFESHPPMISDPTDIVRGTVNVTQ